MRCSLEGCPQERCPLKLTNEQNGETFQFCCLAHLGGWLITKMDASCRSLVNMLSTSAGRKMAVRVLADRILLSLRNPGACRTIGGARGAARIQLMPIRR
jgi:hypothetical protein